MAVRSSEQIEPPALRKGRSGGDESALDPRWRTGREERHKDGENSRDVPTSSSGKVHHPWVENSDERRREREARRIPLWRGRVRRGQRGRRQSDRDKPCQEGGLPDLHEHGRKISLNQVLVKVGIMRERVQLDWSGARKSKDKAQISSWTDGRGMRAIWY